MRRATCRRLLTCAFGLLAAQVQGAILNSDGSASDTQARVNAAANGDTVLLPASGSFTWSTTVRVPSTKAITIDLNGRTVTLSGAAGEFIISASEAGLGGVNRVTNGAIARGAGHGPYSGPFKIDDSRSGAGVRVDHLTFTGENVLVDLNGQGAGVMHDCVFTGLHWAQEFIHVMGWGAGNTAGWTTDSGSSLAGSPHVFTIEDCTFIQNTSSSGVAWIQGYYGCRLVLRHNTFDWVSVDMHGTAGNVGTRWWECYANAFTNDSTGGGQPSWAFSMRAGSGVIFDNTMAPGAGRDVSIGLCEEDTGYPAAYQIGRGLNSSLDPVYVWNNTTIALALNACDAPEQPDMVQLNRDVYASARPGYTPFVYPHPLRGGAVRGPSAPSNLRVGP